jgi:hypothetical protein
VVVLALIRLTLNLNQSKKGDMQMNVKTSKTLSATLTGIAEVVWDIGTKVTAGSLGYGAAISLRM